MPYPDDGCSSYYSPSKAFNPEDLSCGMKISAETNIKDSNGEKYSQDHQEKANHQEFDELHDYGLYSLSSLLERQSEREEPSGFTQPREGNQVQGFGCFSQMPEVEGKNNTFYRN